ncbi:MAG: hypothetical protein HGB21_17840, partial [Nitrospirae bacterium]|nr:hypothetical protein [Nitrospirota bacterium]
MRFARSIACMMLFAVLAACITTPDEVVMAPIHQALTAGNATKVERAAADRGQLAALNEYGETPLFYAVKQRKPDLVDILLSKGADVNAPNPRSGETPLIAAIRNNDEPMVKRLLATGARPDQADNEGTTPLQWAIRKSKLTLVKTVTSEVGTGKVSGQPAAILEASAFGQNEALEYLLSIGSPVNARSARGETPLILAARFGHSETVRMLLDNQAEVNALDKDGASALTWAARMGRPAIVGALVDAGAALDPVDSASFSPLAHAVRLGHAEVVALLVARNADVNLKLPKGASMLYWAAFQDKIAEQLYDTGARIR